MKPGKKGALLVLLLLTLLFQTPASYTTNAYVTVTFFDRSNNRSTTEVCECGIYGLASPVANAGGKVGIPKSLNYQACDPHTEFTYSETPWIALIERGNCTFSEKIQTANRRGAEAAVIYNVPESGNETLQMANFDGILYHRWRIVPDCCNDGMSTFMKFDHHPHVAGAGDIVSIMIGNLKGTKILQSIQRGIQVTMVIEVGKKHGPWMNHYSIFFVSVSFFIVTAATVGYFIFYSARRLRNARAQNRKQRQLKADAKRAIGKLQLRALKHGDKETGPDGDSCAVCIEIFRPNDIVRILTCNHLFHKTCIDPWLLEHRTCPMCKCDILKALGVEADVEAGTVSFQTAGSDPNINGSPESYSPREEDSHSETASSGYASVQGADEPPLEERAQSQNDHLRLVNHDASSVAVDVLPQLDNPAFEEDEPPPFEVPIYPNKF